MVVFLHSAATSRYRNVCSGHQQASQHHHKAKWRFRTLLRRPNSSPDVSSFIIHSKVGHFIPISDECVCAYPFCLYRSCEPSAINLKFMSQQVRLTFLRTSLTIISEPRIYVLPSDHYVIQTTTAVLNICGTPNPIKNLAITKFLHDNNKRTFHIHKYSLVSLLLISV